MPTANWKPMLVLFIGCYACTNEPTPQSIIVQHETQPEKEQQNINKPVPPTVTATRPNAKFEKQGIVSVLKEAISKEKQPIKDTIQASWLLEEKLSDEPELTAGSGGDVQLPAIEARPILGHTKSSLLFNQLLPSIERMAIYNNQGNSIEGKKGTKIYIPKECFVDAEGNMVKGMVNIELLEINNVGDFLKANLQTISNGQLLQSEGMFFIDAKAGGQSLQLAPGKQLQIKQPIMGKKAMTADLRIFSGNRDSIGNINWTETNLLSKKLVPLPLNLFDFTYWKNYKYSHSKREETIEVGSVGTVSSKDTQTFKQKHLTNTFIATREFQKRFFAIVSAEWRIGYKSFQQTGKNKGWIVVDSTISNIYLRNTDKDLWYCDSLAYAYLKTWVVKPGFDVHIGFFSMDGGYVSSESLLNTFKNFYEERFTTVTKIPTDVELWKYDAREQLLAKGYKENEIDDIMDAYVQQKTIMNAISDRKAAELLSYNSFAIAKLGWINCDRFYNEPNARPATILASVNNKDSFPFTTAALVLNGRRVLLNGMLNSNDSFSFTGSADSYTKLPIGEKATIVAMSYKNGKPYLGIKELVLEEKASYKLNMEETSVAEINKKLAGLY